MIREIGKGLLIIFLSALSLVVTCCLLLSLLFRTGATGDSGSTGQLSYGVLDRYDMYITNEISNALEGVLEIDKVYWLSDADPVAPKPDPSCFGQTQTAAHLAGILEQAKPLLDGQDLLFSTQTQTAPGTNIHYYLDETILAITWKLVIDDTVYTVSEVKLAHPSQFRRFLAGGEYGSEIQLHTTQMAQQVNAVVASSGDFYRFRRMGVIVYDGVVQRVDSEKVDTCYINDQGDLLFSYRGELADMESAQEFVDKHNIRFSLAFGPVLIDGGESKRIYGYGLGEIDSNYARAALCQRGPLHYLLVTANAEGNYRTTPSLHTMQKHLETFGCEKVYTLDGGQTAAIVMNGELMNRVVYGYQRNISDIIYFATALPEGG